MNNFSSAKIKTTFLDFFKNKDHKLIEGTSIIPKNDPTLLFINSGMAPMKKYFLGSPPPYPRLSNIQPCIRTNDIEDIGDRHHLTFFEMLGSWSIGDYFKEEAIELAFNLLTEHFKYPVDKLYATVYKGNTELNISPDIESIKFWKKVGLPDDHIVPLGDDNFWGPAGETGPCGPCTEVFFDTGEQYGPTYYPGGYFDDKNRYIEIWNAGVFMELNKDNNGNFAPLPFKSVDTGSGLERMFLALNKCESLYDIDTILPIYKKAKKTLGSVKIEEKDIRIVTDHLRTASYILGEGIVPDKDGRGYIARRLIRKSIAVSLRANIDPLKLKEVIKEAINQLSSSYPFLKEKEQTILKIFEKEVSEFTPKIQKGFEILENKISKNKTKIISSNLVFDLVTSHGVPYEIITDYADRNGLKINEKEYQEKYREHQSISRSGKKDTNSKKNEQIKKTTLSLNKTKFTGDVSSEEKATILKIFDKNDCTNEVEKGQIVDIIFDKTPFYAESGGQVGDTGKAKGHNSLLLITDTKIINNVIIHTAKIEKDKIKVGESLILTIDKKRRKTISKNHSATHLLHSSLRSVLGKHVEQKGSLVNDKKLRFDFSHPKPLTDSELKNVEIMINSWIWENYNIKIDEMEYEQAIKLGSISLFNEKYEKKVKVVQIGGISTELCGGTHIKTTSELSLFSIIKESGIAKGIRRIEAITGEIAYTKMKSSQDLLKSASKYLSCTNENILETIKKIKSSKKETLNFKKSINLDCIKENSFVLTDRTKVFVGILNKENVKSMKIVAEQKIKKLGYGIAFIICEEKEKISANILIAENLITNYQANNILNSWLIPHGGKGGGQSMFARGAVKGINKLNSIFMSVENLIQ